MDGKTREDDEKNRDRQEEGGGRDGVQRAFLGALNRILRQYDDSLRQVRAAALNRRRTENGGVLGDNLRPVTLLELELQAEVDKYVTAVTLLGAQGGKADAATVHERLFNQIHFHQDLPDERLERYQHANHYAAKYCRALTSNFPSHGHQPKFISELRRFYRLTQNEKIRRIESAGS